jgi:hypothetical protein
VLTSVGPDLRALVTDLELGGEMSGVQLAQHAKHSSINWREPAAAVSGFRVPANFSGKAFPILGELIVPKD